jgi:hypothetical protein
MKRNDPAHQPRATQPDAQPEFIDTDELARRTGVKAQTWRVRRLKGDGPPFYRIGKHIRYRWGDEVLAWLETRKRRSTSPTAAEREARKPTTRKPKAEAAHGTRCRPPRPRKSAPSRSSPASRGATRELRSWRMTTMHTRAAARSAAE